MISFSCKEIADQDWCAFLRSDSILVNVINGFFEIERISLTLTASFQSVDKQSNRSTYTSACLSECVRSSGRTPSSKFFLSLLCLPSARCLSHGSSMISSLCIATRSCIQSIQIYETEYYFGNGICKSRPHSHVGRLILSKHVGVTTLTQDEIETKILFDMYDRFTRKDCKPTLHR